jgi:thiamine kinase-like enzyme
MYVKIPLVVQKGDKTMTMTKEMHYNLAFRQGAVEQADAEKYIDHLEEDTLNHLTHMSFDRRLIKPIMETAWTQAEDDEDEDFNSIVHGILNDKGKMLIFMNRYCR